MELYSRVNFEISGFEFCSYLLISARSINNALNKLENAMDSISYSIKKSVDNKEALCSLDDRGLVSLDYQSLSLKRSNRYRGAVEFNELTSFFCLSTGDFLTLNELIKKFS